MKKFLSLVVLTSALLCAGQVAAKGVSYGHKGGNTVPYATITGVPLIINIGADNSFQVFNTTIGGGQIGQIYPSNSNTLADMGWFVSVGTALTAPDFSAHGTTATGSLGDYVPFSGSSVSGVSGSGTAASPFAVSVIGTTSTGLATRQTVTYVNGENFFRKTLRVSNNLGGPVVAKIFLASDIYLASSDQGKPYQEESSGSPGGQTCAGISPVFTILHIALGPIETALTADGYSNVWAQVGAKALNNAISNADCIDNGAGLQWDVTIPANGNVSIQAVTSFGELPTSVLGYGEPIWNYTVLDGPNISTAATACIRARFPGNRLSNAPGWAPSEGTFYEEEPGNPGTIQPPTGLARAILDCFVNAWNDQNGVLNYPYCWDGFSPAYHGQYPDQRLALFRIYFGVNGVCNGPTPGASVFESYVALTRRLFFPRLPAAPPPMFSDGFEF